MCQHVNVLHGFALMLYMMRIYIGSEDYDHLFGFMLARGRARKSWGPKPLHARGMMLPFFLQAFPCPSSGIRNMYFVTPHATDLVVADIDDQSGHVL